MSQLRLDGHVAIVSGSSRGIGRGIAESLAEAGAAVAVTWNRAQEAADDVVHGIEKRGGRAISVQLDVTQRASVRRCVAKTIESLGGLDLVVNNAGHLAQKPFVEIDDADWNYTFDCNLKGAFVFAQEVYDYFSAQRSGSLINIASIGGQTGGTKAPHYAAAKAALISLTHSLAKIYAPFDVRVNAISPGYIRTDMYEDIATRESEDEIIGTIPLGRIGEVQDVCGAALYLASEESSYVTGHVLNVNGGFYLG